MEQEKINQQWEYNFFCDGVFVVVYNYLVKGKKDAFSITGGDDFNQRLFDKNPRLKEIASACVEVQKELLHEISQLPNMILDIEDGLCEIKECEIIKKHIMLGNIKVDEDFELPELDIFNFENDLYVDLIVDDIVYKDLCKYYINNTPEWKTYFKEHHQREIEYDEAMNNIGRKQQQVMNILAQNGTDIYGSNL